MRRIAFTSCLIFAGLALSGCQTPIVDETGPLAIRSVSVTSRSGVGSQSDLAPPLQQAASAALVGGNPMGTPANVAIAIDKVAYKNPMMSLLVGSTNMMNTSVTITSEDGRALANFPHVVILDAAVNGVVGAVMAAAQDKGNTDRRFVQTAADTLKVRIYGRPGHKPKIAAPVRTMPEPAAVSATPAPAAVQPAPGTTSVPVS